MDASKVISTIFKGGPMALATVFLVMFNGMKADLKDIKKDMSTMSDSITKLNVSMATTVERNFFIQEQVQKIEVRVQNMDDRLRSVEKLN